MNKIELANLLIESRTNKLKTKELRRKTVKNVNKEVNESIEMLKEIELILNISSDEIAE